jgi:hypothetical protein
LQVNFTYRRLKVKCKFKPPSRFLKEPPPELVEDADARDKRPVNPAAGKKMFDVLRSAIN